MTKLKIIVLFILLLGFRNTGTAQSQRDFKSIDEIMEQIPDSLTYSTDDIANYIHSNFFTQSEKVRAVFYWIAANISYDYNNLFSLSENQGADKEINEILNTRKGVCRDYSNLFADICGKVGMKAYVVDGYTKKDKRVIQNPHAWCAVLVDSIWYLTDPTWGAGYMEDTLFVKKLNNKYFKVAPDKFINSHIPFDPLWQLLNYPITKKEFPDRKPVSKNNKYFNFIDTMLLFEKQSKIERLLSSGKRIESNGISNYLDYDNLYHIKFNIKSYYQKITEEQYSNALNSYNEGIFLFNQYIEYKNRNYLPYKEDEAIKQMLDNISDTLNLSLIQLEGIENIPPVLERSIKQLERLVQQALADVAYQKVNLDKYLVTCKKYRETLINADEKQHIN